MGTPDKRSGSRAWITAKDAPRYLNRPQRTIYRWIEAGEIRSMRPLHERWLYLPDLTRMDAKTPRRRRNDSQRPNS